MDTEVADREAADWTARGIALVATRETAALREAVTCFDRAIAVRTTIIATGRPEYAYGLAAAWLNRGEALLVAADRESLAAAVASFDEGLRALAGLAQDDPNIRYRLATGWQNRGLALHTLGDRAADAVDSFERALAVLDVPGAVPIRGHRTVAAAILVNLATTLAVASDPDARQRAQEAAGRVIAEVPLADAARDLRLAESAIKARHVLCRVLAAGLPGAGQPASDTLHAVTDAVDDGLALARRWEQQGVEAFRDLAADLLRFGIRVYATYQPQFLNDLVLENLDPSESSGSYVADPAMRVARLEALWLSFCQSPRGAQPSRSAVDEA